MDEKNKDFDNTTESYKAQSAQQAQHGGTCPHCGYCPHCGRSARPYQFWPYYQPYYGPWYGSNTPSQITWTSSTGQTSGVATYGFVTAYNNGGQ